MLTKLLKALFILICPLVIASCALQLEIGNTFFADGRYDQAAFQWNPIALAGDPYAQYNLGLIWENGLGSTPKDLNMAANWYVKSAQQGYVNAMVRLAEVQAQLGHPEVEVFWLDLAAKWGNLSELKRASQPIAACPCR